MGITEKIRQLFPCCRTTVQAESRTIHVGHEVPDGLQVEADAEVTIAETYPDNTITSSRYTALNFVPKNLFEQFHRIANFYFLCVAIVMLVIDTPVSAWTSIAPLIFVVSVTMMKQGYEDWLRHKSDNEVNLRKAIIIKNGKSVTSLSKDIQVGDIVKVTVNQEIPCDLVMLSSEDPQGECYITTANLDGETNLKTFSSVFDTRYLQTEESFTAYRGTVECQQPIEDLYSFAGRITTYSSDLEGGKNTASLGADNVLLRGSRLKNTSHVYGCAIYTGDDSKISLNSRYKSHKYSRVERRMNTFLITFLIILTVYSAVWVVLQWNFYRDPSNSMEANWYIGFEQPELGVVTAIAQFLTFMVLCNYVIPISMYVTVEMIKFVGSMFFAWDVDMYDPITNEPAKANTSDINEELGQVEYLFTDKTGTLTENTMEFKQCSVNARLYVEVGGYLCDKPDIPGVQPFPVNVYPTEVEDMLTAMALCHTVRVDKKDNLATGSYSETGQEYEYQASSPDEKALVEAARNFGVVYHGIKDDRMEVTFRGQMRRYIPHHILDFDPTRKRMSIIVQDEDGTVLLLSKGADSAILDRIISGDIDTAEKHIDEYALLGLRTLCYASKVLTEEEFKGFDHELKSAKRALENRQEKLAVAYDNVEKNFQLLGATAVEDKLQDGVPETISALREAGIQVWVLTGDKVETAVNISYSAGHFYQGVLELRLTRVKNEDDCGEILDEFQKILLDYRRLGERKHALILDGQSLVHALKTHIDTLREVCKGVVTVLCCRMTPIQKAQVVQLIKDDITCPTTAAIGDGANDVSMIQQAHVGIGIMGKEGRQAVRSSDYAFGRFKFLKRALLVHGHYYYIRLATLVQYFFYKNVAMITAQLYFTFFSAFSAQTVFESFLLAFFNITFSALPILLYGFFEMHISQKRLEKYPELYKTIRNNAPLSNFEFAKWNLIGLYQSLVYFFGFYFIYMNENPPGSDGKMGGVYDWGTMIMTACVLSVNLKLMLETYHYNGLIIGGFIVGVGGGYFLLVYVYNVISISWTMIPYHDLFGTFATMYAYPSIWLSILLLVVTAAIPDIIIRALRDMLSPVYRKERATRIDKRDQYIVGQPVTLVSFTCGSRLSSISTAELIDSPPSTPSTPL